GPRPAGSQPGAAPPGGAEHVHRPGDACRRRLRTALADPLRADGAFRPDHAGRLLPCPCERQARHDPLTHPAMGCAEAAHGAPSHLSFGRPRKAHLRSAALHLRPAARLFRRALQGRGPCGTHLPSLGRDRLLHERDPAGGRKLRLRGLRQQSWHQGHPDSRRRAGEDRRDLVPERSDAMSAMAETLPLDAPRLMPATPILRMEGITRRFGNVVALKNVSATVYPGEVLGIVGESGSGKSTLLRLMNLEDSPDEGHYRLDIPDADGNLFDLDRYARRMLRARHIGIVYQNPHLGLLMRNSSSGNVAERLLIAGERRFAELRARAEDALSASEFPLERMDA